MAELNGPQKARVLLSLLGEQALAKIVRYLPVPHVEKLQKATQMEAKVTPELVQKVIEEFARFSSLPPAGREPAAKRTGREEVNVSVGKRVAKLLEQERLQMVAFVLKKVMPQTAGEVLVQFPEKRKEIEVISNRMEWVPVSEKIEAKLRKILEEALSKN